MQNGVFVYCFPADYSPFLGIEKGAVLQEARVFNDPQLDARRCSQVIILPSSDTGLHFVYIYMCCSELIWVFSVLIQVITKLLYLLNQGESFTKVRFLTWWFIISILSRSRLLLRAISITIIQE